MALVGQNFFLFNTETYIQGDVPPAISLIPLEEVSPMMTKFESESDKQILLQKYVIALAVSD